MAQFLGLAVCSYREPGFCSQDTCDGLQLTLTPLQEDPMPSSYFLHQTQTRYTQIYADKTLMDINLRNRPLVD